MLLLDKIPHVTRRDLAEEFNIIIRMELCHFALRGRLRALKNRQQFSISQKESTTVAASRGYDAALFTYENLHPLIQPVVHNKRVAHADPSGFHARRSQKIVHDSGS